MNYQKEVKEFVLSSFTLRRIEEFEGVEKKLLAAQKTHKWIWHALMKKHISNWEQYGFGLMFNSSFNEQVYAAMKRGERVESAKDADIYTIAADPYNGQQLKNKDVIHEYMQELSKSRQKQLLIAIEDLLIDKKSWNYLREGLLHKPISYWEQYGFGLLFNKSYQSQMRRHIMKNNNEDTEYLLMKNYLIEVA